MTGFGQFLRRTAGARGSGRVDLGGKGDKKMKERALFGAKSRAGVNKELVG